MTIDEIPNCWKLIERLKQQENKAYFSIDFTFKMYYYIQMQPNAYKTTYLCNWTFIDGSRFAFLFGPTPAFAMVRANGNIDMSIVRQFGMNT